ncbi:MAG: response regulator [Geobacter sp.]|nr:response regulator [Geobacter sp.]
MPTPTVLLVDDVMMFLEIEKGILKLSPVHVLTARNGAEALDIVRKDRPALVFMDLHMPIMNGAECCAAIKADPALRATPVIMVTSAGHEQDRNACLEAGCDDFLFKPIERTAFLEKARCFLQSIDRRHPRIPLITQVRFKVHGVTLSGETMDISEGGMFICADYDVGLGSQLDMEFTLPGSRGMVIRAKGMVSWLNLGKGKLKSRVPAGFGVEFVELDEKTSNAIKFFLDAANLG